MYKLEFVAEKIDEIKYYLSSKIKEQTILLHYIEWLALVFSLTFLFSMDSFDSTDLRI